MILIKKKHKEICRRYCIEKYHQNVDVAPASDYSLTARAESDRAVDFCTGPSFKHLMVTKSRTLDRVMIVWLWLWLVVFQKCPMWKSWVKTLSGTRKLVTTSRSRAGPNFRWADLHGESRCHCWLASNVGQQVVFERIKLLCTSYRHQSYRHQSYRRQQTVVVGWKKVETCQNRMLETRFWWLAVLPTTNHNSSKIPHLKKTYFHMIHMHIRYVYNESMWIWLMCDYIYTYTHTRLIQYLIYIRIYIYYTYINHYAPDMFDVFSQLIYVYIYRCMIMWYYMILYDVIWYYMHVYKRRTYIFSSKTLEHFLNTIANS